MKKIQLPKVNLKGNMKRVAVRFMIIFKEVNNYDER